LKFYKGLRRKTQHVGDPDTCSMYSAAPIPGGAEIVDALTRRSTMLRQIQSYSGPLMFKAARLRLWTASPLGIIHTV